MLAKLQSIRIGQNNDTKNGLNQSAFLREFSQFDYMCTVNDIKSEGRQGNTKLNI